MRIPADDCDGRGAALRPASTNARIARRASRRAPSPTVWDRQIRNAADAGDGDYLLESAARSGSPPSRTIFAVRLELAKAYRERGYPEVALEICRLAAARFPESGEAQLALVRALCEMKRPQEAIAALEAHPRAHSRRDYYSWLGILRDETGAWEAGEPAHRQAVELAPAQDSLHNNLGYNLLMQKKNEEAAAEFREALRLNPASQMARNNLGMALANSNASPGGRQLADGVRSGDRAQQPGGGVDRKRELCRGAQGTGYGARL